MSGPTTADLAAMLTVGDDAVCPLCEWTCPLPESVADAIDPDLIAGRFERSTTGHLATHGPEDWLPVVVRQRLNPAESMALTVVLEQIKRHEDPGRNIAHMCTLALARTQGRYDWTAQK